MNNNLFNKFSLIQSLFKSVEREWHLEYSNLLKSTNAIVSPNQGEALEIISHYGPISLKRVGELIISERKSPSRLIQNLVNKGLVSKEISKTDKRLNVLSVTISGSNEIKKIHQAKATLYRKFTKNFKNPENMDLFIKMFSDFTVDSESKRKLKERFDIDL